MILKINNIYHDAFLSVLVKISFVYKTQLITRFLKLKMLSSTEFLGVFLNTRLTLHCKVVHIKNILKMFDPPKKKPTYIIGDHGSVS